MEVKRRQFCWCHWVAVVVLVTCVVASSPAMAQVSARGKLAITMVDTETAVIELCATQGTPPNHFYIESLPAHGTLEDDGVLITSNALPYALGASPLDLTYVPSNGYSGLDSFQFYAADQGGAGTPSSAAWQEVAVQTAGSVFISEVMHTPTTPQFTMEFIEIINTTGVPIDVERIDTDRSTTRDTTSNAVFTIPADTVMLLAADTDTTAFRCEWRLESDSVHFVPSVQFERMFADPDAECEDSYGSRLLLFGPGGILYDAVDLGAINAGSGLCETVSYTLNPDRFYSPPVFAGPPTSETNDVIVRWGCAGPSPSVNYGLQTGGTAGDYSNIGSVVPGLPSVAFTFAESCYGACCLTSGDCTDGVTEQECRDLTCYPWYGTDRWTQGDTCAELPPTECSNQAETAYKCCHPIGHECVEVAVCECELGGGTSDEGNHCTGNDLVDCPDSVELVVNELEYQETGTDTEEYLELYGPGGQSLVGWSLEFYNGADSNGLTSNYLSVDLGESPDSEIPGDGYLVVGSLEVENVDLIIQSAYGYDDNIIQNEGARPDGIVLMYDGPGPGDAVVVEAFSYGGSNTNGFWTVGGAAPGIFLTTIGVRDIETTTLQKLPDANSNGWTATLNQTPGSMNVDETQVGACCVGEECTLEFPDVCTTGMGGIFKGLGTNCDGNPCIPRGACCLPDGSCVDAMQQDTCEGPLLGTWNGDGTVCNDLEAFAACLLGPSGGLSPECEVWDLDDTIPGDVDLADFALYQQNECKPAATGACCGLDGECYDISEVECDLICGDYRGNGVTCPPDPACDPAVPGAIVINEIWADDPGTDDPEFIELYGTPLASLAGLSLIIVDGDTEGERGSDTTEARRYRRVILQADLGTYALDASGFFTTGFSNDELIQVLFDVDLDAVFGNDNDSVDDIQNGSQTYALVPTLMIEYCTSSGVPDAGCYGNDGELTPSAVLDISTGAVDMVATVDDDFGDDAYFCAPVVQDGNNAFDYAQRIPNGVDLNSVDDWETLFGNEFGDNADPSSPDEVNYSQETIAGACCSNGICSEVLRSVCEADGGVFLGYGSSCLPNICECKTVAEARAMDPELLTIVTICDVVITSTTNLSGGAAYGLFHVQDQVGDELGYTIYGSATTIENLLLLVGEGDQVDLSGPVAAYASLAELGTTALPVTLVNDDGPVGVPAATTISAADIVDDSPTAEGLESKEVILPCVKFQETGTFAYGNYHVSEDPEAAEPVWVTVRVSTDRLDLIDSPIPTGWVTVSGMLGQYTWTGHPDGTIGYQLLLRGLADIDDSPTCP